MNTQLIQSDSEVVWWVIILAIGGIVQLVQKILKNRSEPPKTPQYENAPHQQPEQDPEVEEFLSNMIRGFDTQKPEPPPPPLPPPIDQLQQATTATTPSPYSKPTTKRPTPRTPVAVMDVKQSAIETQKRLGRVMIRMNNMRIDTPRFPSTPIGQKHNQGIPPSFASLGTRKELLRAMVLREIVGPPKALARNRESVLGI